MERVCNNWQSFRIYCTLIIGATKPVILVDYVTAMNSLELLQLNYTRRNEEGVISAEIRVVDGIFRFLTVTASVIVVVVHALPPSMLNLLKAFSLIQLDSSIPNRHIKLNKTIHLQIK